MVLAYSINISTTLLPYCSHTSGTLLIYRSHTSGTLLLYICHTYSTLQLCSSYTATNNNKGADETEARKMQNLIAFTGELEPVISQLNSLIDKYGIVMETTISLSVRKNRVEPFISYAHFPSSLSNGLDK